MSENRDPDKVVTMEDAEDLLRFAKGMFVIYEAFQHAGFTDDQAFSLTRACMGASGSKRTPSVGQYL